MHADLLQQAESLARLDQRGAPRQAQFRPHTMRCFISWLTKPAVPSSVVNILSRDIDTPWPVRSSIPR